jgi:hypothetical protein
MSGNRYGPPIGGGRRDRGRRGVPNRPGPPFLNRVDGGMPEGFEDGPHMGRMPDEGTMQGRGMIPREGMMPGRY